MIFDSIYNYKNYIGYPELYDVLSFLANLKEGELVKPNTVLIPDRIFCNLVKFVSKQEKECKYEAHKKYIDVHYIVKGAEGIATADVNRLHEDTPFDEAKDIGFYTGNEEGRYYLKKVLREHLKECYLLRWTSKLKMDTLLLQDRTI